MADEVAPCTVLIVDDEMDMRLMIRLVLESVRNGIEVVAEATDGEHALQVLDELDPPPVPSVVVLDNRMPGLTGLEVAQRLQAAHTVSHVVLFSAYLDDDVIEEAKKYGIDACVSKTEAMRLPQVILELTRGT